MADEEFKIDRFTIVGDLFSGQVSDVYEVVEDGTSNRFAMKLLHNEKFEERNLVQQFRQEAKLGQKLEHPNLCRVRDVVIKVGGLLPVKNPIAYFTMDMFRSLNVKAFLASDQLGLQLRLKKALEQICSVLGYLHNEGWVHRDIKPDNLLLNKASEARLIDFSLVVKKNRRTGKIQGTRTYIAPETIKKKRATPATDIYSLGITLYEILTNEAPFKASTPTELLKRHIGARAIPPRELNPNVTPELERLVLRMLAKKPADRQESAEELMGEVRNTKFYERPIEELIEIATGEEVVESDLVKTLDSRLDAKRSALIKVNPEKAEEVYGDYLDNRQAVDRTLAAEQEAAGQEEAVEPPMPAAPPAPPMPAAPPMPVMPPGVVPVMVPAMPYPAPVVPGQLPAAPPLPMPMASPGMPGMPMPAPGMPMAPPGMPMPAPGMPMPGVYPPGTVPPPGTMPPLGVVEQPPVEPPAAPAPPSPAAPDTPSATPSPSNDDLPPMMELPPVE